MQSNFYKGVVDRILGPALVLQITQRRPVHGAPGLVVELLEAGLVGILLQQHEIRQHRAHPLPAPV